MNNLMDYPLPLFLVTLMVLWLATQVGVSLRQRWDLNEQMRGDFDVIHSATLTLLALIIGFSVSMAVNRYDLRKHYEAEEANAIGTEYVRADLLPAEQAQRVQTLLLDYNKERILFYVSRDWFFSSEDEQQIAEMNTRTAALQAELWAAVLSGVAEKPLPVTTLAVSGMNDVLNTQGYALAARWNRIPQSIWVLLFMVAILASVMLGFGTHDIKGKRRLLQILPFVVAVSFLLIADIDSPRAGFVRVQPQNLLAFADSFGKTSP